MPCGCFMRTVPLVLSTAIIVAGCGPRSTESVVPGVIPYAIVPTHVVPSSPELLALGKTTFEKECAACHGVAGDRLGDAAYLLYPRPRDFTSGQFRLI